MAVLSFEDYSRIVSVVDPQLSPLGDRIAFVTTRVDVDRDCYVMNVWIISSEDGEVLLFTRGDRDSWPRWSPDGGRILFISRRTLGEGEKGGELWVLNVGGGEPRLVCRLSGGIELAQWSPDGRRILFISRVVDEDFKGDVHVVRRIPVWFNGVGYSHYFRRHLFVIDVYSGNVRQLTSGDFDVLYASFSSRGDRICFSAKVDDMRPRRHHLFVISSDGGEPRRISGEGMFIGPLNWSPDDEYVVFRGSDLSRGYATHENIWIINVESGEIENLTRRLDRGSSRRVYYDVRGPYSVDQPPIWDGNYIYFHLSSGGRLNIYRLNVEDRGVEPIVAGNFMVDNFTVKDGVIAYSRITEVEPAEIWIYRDGRHVKLTDFNREFLERVKLSKPENFKFTASDGAVVEGWIMRPVEFREGEKYPAILNIHGGPKSAFGYAFMFENQILAANGYVVIYVNPRGSDGYSEEFADIRGGYGERDYMDLMEAVDYAISRYEFIDSSRLGVTGISYGGFMTNWIITKTDRFKAAVSLNGICSWLAEFGTADIGFHFVPDQIGGDYWSNREAYIEKSPLTYADRVKTPLMIIHSVEDFRCWLDQALLFYTALKYLGREVELVLFMKGNHVFSRSGIPSHRIERLRHTIRWFNKYLK